MIAAWVLFAGTAITLARYYKDMWPGTKVPVYDKPVWFSVSIIIIIIIIILFKVTHCGNFRQNY